MIDIKKAQNEFLEYTKNYDLEDENIKRKQGHSLRVMAISKKIAEKLKLDGEKIELATLIGLLHDIARFEQYTRYKTFRDADSIDHGDYAVEILERDIRKYIDTNKYDSIIKVAIKNHNKYKIEDGLNEEELLFSKIIRDADKLDIFYEAIEMFWKGTEEEISNSILDEEIEKQIKNRLQVFRKKDYNPKGINKVMATISFIYDINFKESFQIIKENDYINKILDRFDFKEYNTKQKVIDIRKIIDEYINSKIND